MTFEEIREADEKYIMHSYGRLPVALKEGKGATVWDWDGKKYIDCTSGIGVNCLGHNYLPLQLAIQEQMHHIMHICNLYYSEPTVKAAKLLTEASGMDKVFFANSGAEANEGMIKLARKYSIDHYGPERTTIITLQQSFHGRTITTLKATGQDRFHHDFLPYTKGFDYAVANDIEDLKAKIDDKTCAVMLEMIQGEGGVLPLTQEYAKAVEQLCREKELLLLVDEVQTGIGRTGTLFCYEQYGIHPNVVSMAKALGGGVPIGGVLADKTCSDTFTPGTHGATFGGNPLCCTAAQVVLSTVTQPDFLQAVREKSAYIQDKVLGFHSPNVKGVRGMGLMLGIIVDPDKLNGYVSALIEKGVLVLTAGSDAIRLLPPLVITYEELDQALAALKEVLCA